MFHSSFSNKISEMSTSSQNKEISVEILSAYLQENRIASYIETAGILSISFSSHYRTLLHFPSMYTISSPVRLGELVWGGVYPLESGSGMGYRTMFAQEVSPFALRAKFRFLVV
jgi:hypothetical protein